MATRLPLAVAAIPRLAAVPVLQPEHDRFATSIGFLTTALGPAAVD
jgi:hypothetical protein